MRVKVQRVFPNCPRYIHRMALVERSPYGPRKGAPAPVPEWKRSFAQAAAKVSDVLGDDRALRRLERVQRSEGIGSRKLFK